MLPPPTPDNHKPPAPAPPTLIMCPMLFPYMSWAFAVLIRLQICCAVALAAAIVFLSQCAMLIRDGCFFSAFCLNFAATCFSVLYWCFRFDPLKDHTPPRELTVKGTSYA